MHLETRRPAAPKLVFGLLLIVVGVTFTLDRMGWIDAGDVFQFWPLLLVAIGASKLLGPANSSRRLFGWVLIVVGGWLQLEAFDVVYFNLWDYWPLLLILIGIRIVWRGLVGESLPRASEDDSTVNAVTVLGGLVRSNSSQDFRGGDMFAFMGGCEIDMRSARIAAGPAVIDASAFWGGVVIRVPSDWVVTVEGVPFLGGYEDNTESPYARRSDHVSTMEDYEWRQELVVRGFAIMGGVEVKN